MFPFGNFFVLMFPLRNTLYKSVSLTKLPLPLNGILQEPVKFFVTIHYFTALFLMWSSLMIGLS